MRRKPQNRHAHCNTPEALARRKDGNEARSIAGPAPIYPLQRKAGEPTGEYVELFWRGQFVRWEFGNPFPPRPGHRPRCDQASVLVGDQVPIGAAGLVAIFDALRDAVAPAMSLRAIAGLQQGYSAQYEADAAAADGAFNANFLLGVE